MDIHGYFIRVHEAVYAIISIRKSLQVYDSVSGQLT